MIDTSSLTINGEYLHIPYLTHQDEIFYHLPIGKKFIVIPKGRRLGATHGAMNFCIDAAISGKSILWVDTVQGNIDKYFTRYAMPILKYIKPEYYRYRAQYKDLRVLNSNIDFRSAEKPQNIEGFGYDIIIVNEAGIVLKGQKGRDLWFNSLRPMTLDYGPTVFFLGTPKGKKSKKGENSESKTSLYYELALKGGLECRADKMHPSYITQTYTSYNNYLLNPQDIAELEEDVPMVTRKQEISGKYLDLGDSEVFKEHWFNVIEPWDFDKIPKHLYRRKIMSLDTAFKKGAENDDSAGIVIQEVEHSGSLYYYWLDTFCEKLEFPELIKKTKEFYLKHDPDIVLIEDKASGQSLIQMFKSDVSDLFSPVAIKVDSDKYTRAVAVSPMCEGGKVIIVNGFWKMESVGQLTDFSALLDTPDDIVDAFSQLLNYVRSNRMPTTPPQTASNRKKRKSWMEGY